MENNESKWYHSSNGSQNLALTVKGALLAIVPIIIAILTAQGFSVTENELVDLINSIFTAVSAIAVVAGLTRKFYYSLISK